LLLEITERLGLLASPPSGGGLPLSCSSLPLSGLLSETHLLPRSIHVQPLGIHPELRLALLLALLDTSAEGLACAYARRTEPP